MGFSEVVCRTLKCTVVCMDRTTKRVRELSMLNAARSRSKKLARGIVIYSIEGPRLAYTATEWKYAGSSVSGDQNNS